MKYRKHLDNVERISSPSIDHNKIRLNSAERDLPIDQNIWNKYINSLKETDIRYYPDTEYAKELIAKHEGVKPGQITLGSGSDQVIRNVFECFVNPDENVVTTDPCFPMYGVYGDIYNLNVKKVPYRYDKKDVSAILSAIDFKTSLVILSNPSSPIGDSYSSSELKSIIIRANDMGAIVVIDEAYIQFATNTISLSSDAWSYSNLIVIKTFSKAVGAAGIRFGYGISNCKITKILHKVKSMYEITGPTIKWVETIVNNYTEIALYCEKVKLNREMLADKLKDYYDVVTGECNWIHTTKIDYPEDIETRTCSLPWSDQVWTRLCVPADTTTLLRLLK